jgi:hypothetical protein
MSRPSFEPGDLVSILKPEWAGDVGIVTLPISEQEPGHVLLHHRGSILGIDAALADIAPAGETSVGFAQLGYQLIKLGSHVIEQKLLVYRS